ncbi:MAG: AAA family ATPase, partial [Acinetobacter sp.]|nr:AAA family ATPase [Acinetobacter sp.]
MNTILLVPTGEGAGVTSASLGLVSAFAFKGVQAGFLKPFSQDPRNSVDTTTSLQQHLFPTHKAVQPISYDQIIQALASGQLDELLEDAVKLHREVSAQHNVVVVEGLLPTANDPFVNQINLALAQALDAKVVIVSTADTQNARRSAEKLDAQIRNFGGVEGGRLAGVFFMRTKGLASAEIPLAIDPSLRLNDEIARFTTELQKFNARIGTDKLPILGLVPFSDTLSVPRTFDIADIIEATWLNQGEAKQRRILNTNLV